MDAQSYLREYLFLLTGSLSSLPAHSSNPALCPPQGVPVLDGELSDPWSLVIPDPQVGAEAYSAGLRPPSHSTILAIDSAAETPCPEIPIAASNIHNRDLPPKSDTMCQTTTSSCISVKSTLRGSQGSWSASVISNEDPRDNIIDEADINRNWRQDVMSMNDPLDHSPQYTEIRTTSDFSASSTLPHSGSLTTAVPYQEGASTDILRQSQDLGNGSKPASSRSPLKPGEVRFRCRMCGLDYGQKRGVTRHYRDVHEVTLCLHCSGFEWHRRHQLKEHLEEQHPDIHVPSALAEATRYRRRASMIKNRQHERQASPFAAGYDRWGSGEHLSQPPTPPLPPVLESTHVSSSPAVSRVAYDPQPST